MPRQRDPIIPDVSAPTLAEALAHARRDHPGARVLRLHVGGRRLWMKQCERHASLRKRLSKGNPRIALGREAETLRALAQRGIAVPEVIASDEDHLLLSDSGRTISDMILSPGYRIADGTAACHEAGRALGSLHETGLALGRGKAKDYCWDGDTITFIDLEVAPEPVVADANGRHNLMTFVFDLHFTACRLRRDAHAEARAFLRGYAETDQPGTRAALSAAQRWARRRGWLGALTLPLSFIRPPGRSADLMATASTLIMLAELDAVLAR